MPRSSASSPRRRLGLSWGVLAVVLTAALVVGAGHRGGRPSEAARTAKLTSEIRCPTCRGLSAAESDAKTAQAIRDEVARQVHAGRSDGQILAYVRDRYGTDILLRPPASGFDGLVWALPVAALVLAVAGLAVVFRRWRSVTALAAGPADQARVARALDDASRPEGAP